MPRRRPPNATTGGVPDCNLRFRPLAGDPAPSRAASIERLEAARAPLAVGDGSDIILIDHLARTIRQGRAIYDALPEDPRGDQLIMLLRWANAVMAAVEDVLCRHRLVTT